MKKITVRRALAVVSTLALLCACPMAAGVLAVSGADAVVKIACIGDSVTWGVGGTPYPQQLNQKLGSAFQVKNFGISGACAQNDGHDQNKNDPKKFGYRTSNPATGDWNYNDVYQNMIPNIEGSAGKTKYEQSLLYKADIYIISIGGNDAKACNWNNGKNNFEEDYRALLQEYVDLPWHPIVIVGTSPAAVQDSYTLSKEVLRTEIVPIQRKVAQEMGLPLVDTFSPTRGQTQYYTDDGVHLNTAGYGVVAEQYYQAFRGEKDGYQFNYDEIVKYDFDGKTANVTVPERVGAVPVKKIGKEAFSGNATLTGVALPEGVESIGDRAFANNAWLVSVAIPKSVTAIGEQVFEDCPYVSIHGEKGSYAEQYAKENGIPFVEGAAPEVFSSGAVAIENSGKPLGEKAQLKVKSEDAAPFLAGYISGELFEIKLLDAAGQPTAPTEPVKVYIACGTDAGRSALFRVEPDGSFTEIPFEARNAVIFTTDSPTGTYLVVESGLPGDVDANGEVTTTDARLTLQYSAKKIGAGALDVLLADVDGDRKVTTTDARLILQKAAKKIDRFPVEEK